MHLTLHLTSRCNLRCSYCYDAPHGCEDMSFETARAAIEIARQDTLRRSPGESIGLVFYGGEPLLRRELISQIVQHCSALGAEHDQRFHFKLTTNGLLLDEMFLADRNTAGVFIALSHDGLRQAHDASRVDLAGQGTFDRLGPIARMLLRHRPYTPAMMVVTPETVSHYARSVESLFETGFRDLIVTLDYGAAWARASLRELERQYQALGEWYYAATRAEDKFFFSPFEVKIASHIHPEGCLQERCELGSRQLSVAPDGRLFPCVQFVSSSSAPSLCIGHVSQGIDEAARRRLTELRAHEEQACQSCAIRTRCNHHCGCVNWRATGSLERVSPVVCAHERMVLPIADRLAERLFRKRDASFIHKHYNELYPLVSAVEDLSPSAGLHRATERT